MASTVSLPILSMLVFFTGVTAPEECSVEGLYERVQPEIGALAIMEDYDEVSEFFFLLKPVSIETSRYGVTVSREYDNVYKVASVNLFVRTRYCYEYATSDDAILDVASRQGYTVGDLIFLD